MISTLAYKQSLQSNKNAGLSRFSSMRGRVLSGQGGDLAGFNSNLIKSRAAQEDELMNKKYKNGEISFDELLVYLNKAANRSWVTPEEKSILIENIREMKTQYDDELVAKEYAAGRITPGGVAAYQRSKLATMLPGTPAYENVFSEAMKWDKEEKITNAKLLASKEEARLSSLAEDSNKYSEQANTYRELARQFRMAGDPTTAYSYEAAANQADVNKGVFDTKTKENEQEQLKNDLVDKINIAYNDYHDGVTNAQSFLATLDSLEREAINNKWTDLLDNLNGFVDLVNKDLKKGTGGGGYDSITGEGGTSGSGTITGTTTTGGVSSKVTQSTGRKLSWSEEDAEFKNTVNQLNQDVIDGKISKDEYVTGMQIQIEDRQNKLEERKAAIENSGVSKVLYNGTKQKVGSVIADIDDELNNNWGKQLGMKEAEVGSAGISNMATSLSGDINNVINSLDLTISQSKNVIGADYIPQLSTKNPLSTGYISDTLGRRYKVQSQKTEDVLDYPTFSAGINNGSINPEDYESKSDGTYVKKGSVRWVDMPSESGDTARYFLNEKDEVTKMEPTIRDETKYQQYLPEGQTITSYLASKQPTTIRPLQEVINEATTAAQTEKQRLAEVASKSAAVNAQLTPEQQLENLKASVPEPKVVKPVYVAMPKEAPQQFAERFVEPLSPKKVVKPKQIATELMPSSFVGPLEKNQIKANEPLAPAMMAKSALSYVPPKTEEQPKQNLIQRATSWVSNLLKKKK